MSAAAPEQAPGLQADAGQIAPFFDALFRYADEGTFLSLRAFDQFDKGADVRLIRGVRINGDAAPVVASIAREATRMANTIPVTVFCPPVATFTNARSAATGDLANGVALSIEIDEASPLAGLTRLQSILGPATVVVASGGEWTDPVTGEVHDKLHLHWRLTEPTRTADDHARLREARRLATMLAGGDPTAMPPVHPLRWPGSWNRKREPSRMARIAACNAAAEVDLGDALERLQEAVEAAGLDTRTSTGPRTPGPAQAPLADVAAALSHIPNLDVHWKVWLDLGYATYGATGGSDAGLEAWTAWSAKSSAKHSDDECEKQWARFAKSPPTRIGAGTVFFHAKAAGWQRGRPHAEPRAHEGRKESREGSANDDDAEKSKSSRSAGGSVPPAPGSHDLTQDGVAWKFAARAGGRLAFDHTAQEWFVWESGRWTKDAKAGTFNLVRLFCYALRDADAKPPSDMGKIAFIASVERAARTDPRIATSHEDWDRDRWLLGVPGGVVDLRTGELRSGDPRLFIRRQVAVAPAPFGTPAPLWFAFLREATRGDADLQGFLQRLAGYILTGDVSEEMLTFLYGSGGNGKGVFLGALMAILADYAVSVPIEVFVANTRLNLEYYRARMAGVRLVTASETEAGATWSESLIKELTGNEAPLSARDPYGKPFTFLPHFKLCLVGNHAPRLKGRTPAMERRLRVVPFTHEPQKRDPDLKEKLRAEYPAILRWMIEGCIAWREKRLGSAPAIERATSSYFAQQDGFRRWLNECCDLGPDPSERPGKLFADFTAWSRDNGEPPVSSGEFREMIERTQGLRYVTNKGTRYVRGIALKPQFKRNPSSSEACEDEDETCSG
jgi:putative DNA primase/helicase